MCDYGNAWAIRRFEGLVGFRTTENWKVVLALPNPSLTVRVMFALPVWPANGVIVTVRLLPVPANAMSAFLTSDWLDELADKARLPAAVSVSLIVKGIGCGAEPTTTV